MSKKKKIEAVSINFPNDTSKKDRNITIEHFENNGFKVESRIKNNTPSNSLSDLIEVLPQIQNMATIGAVAYFTKPFFKSALEEGGKLTAKAITELIKGKEEKNENSGKNSVTNVLNFGISSDSANTYLSCIIELKNNKMFSLFFDFQSLDLILSKNRNTILPWIKKNCHFLNSKGIQPEIMEIKKSDLVSIFIGNNRSVKKWNFAS